MAHPTLGLQLSAIHYPGKAWVITDYLPEIGLRANKANGSKHDAAGAFGGEVAPGIVYLGMKLILIISAVLAALLLSSCAPSNVAPPGAIGHGSGFVPFVSRPMAARVQSADGTAALGLRTGPEGFGFQYTVGSWGTDLIVAPRGEASAFARGSYVQDGFTAALSLAWETFITHRRDGTHYVAETVTGGGLGLEVGYFWPIALETGQGYIGPHLYSYVLCRSMGNAPLRCGGLRLNPGFGIGVNVPLGRFTLSPEISLFLLPPDELHAISRLATPFGLSMSFRF
jgi:hypothetical protein